MSAEHDTSTGWYVRGTDGQQEWQQGPYSWAELVGYARDGRLQPHNTVWHASVNDWVLASTVPGLFGAPAQAAPAAVSAVAAVAPAAPKRKRGALVAIAAVSAVIVIAGAGFGTWWFLNRDGKPADKTPQPGDLGAAECALPDADTLVATDDWGEVPAGQLLMMMEEGASRDDAEAAAGSFGGEVVGEVEYVGLYQVAFDGSSESDLMAAIDDAESADGVEYAYPLTQIQLDEEIWGVRSDAFADPVYAGTAGKSLEAIGVSKAWTYINGAGIDLNDVKVGVVDDGIYLPGEGAENEFEGSGVKLEFPDKNAGEREAADVHNGTTNAAGSHGTAVATVIGGDPDNGGPAGVAGPLKDKLTISMINIFGGQYGDSETTADPDDVTKQEWSPGHTYSIGALVALKKQIENGATVINCSWGSSNAHPKDVETYTHFFTKMAEDYPDVLFVCSGGNGGKEMDGAKRYPSGLKLPNMITVGALEADGTRAEYGDWASDDYEITLGAPGTDQVVGLGPDGPVVQSGSSFSAPQVAAAAAMLKAIDPELEAGDIKRILTETARDGVPNTSGDPNATSKLVPSEMGGKILAVDEAVLKVINDMRKRNDQDPLDPEDLEGAAWVDAVAITGEPGEYLVRGIVERVGSKGTTLKIEVYGENYSIGGKTEQSLESAGEVEWDVTLPGGSGSIKVTRTDTGASSLIVIDSIDPNGLWSGSFTYTTIQLSGEYSEVEGCSTEDLEALKGTPMPMTLEITVDDSGTGTATMFVDPSVVQEDASGDYTDLAVTLNGTSLSFSGGDGVMMSADMSRSGSTLTMTGTLSWSGEGFTVEGVFTLTKSAL